ncbi:MAG: hypothetical protein KBB83_06760 [Alphaproteobacteria bacterium]|nr:hypothetical protein [Alphaproteobacteria bacterium]
MIEAQRRAEESKMKCEEQQARVNSLFSNPHPNDRQHMLKRIERLEQIIANAKPKFVINWGSSEVEYMQEVKDENRI